MDKLSAPVKRGNASLRGNLLLLLAAFIWGVAFVAQKEGGAEVGDLTFNGARSFIGGTVLLIAIPILSKLGFVKLPVGKAQWKTTLLGGVLCGVALFLATNLQQIGISYTTVGKSGFITALYIVLVPILGILLRKRTTLFNWLGVMLAVCGLYLLCVQGERGIQIGDLLLLGCALMFSVQILLVDHFVPHTDGVRLSCIQFFTVGILNLPLMFIYEQPSLSAMAVNWLPILYAGVLSSGVAYTLQIVAQKDTHPTTASLLMSFESVFAVLAGWVILQEDLSPTELLGCGLMFAAVILAQLPAPKKRGA